MASDITADSKTTQARHEAIGRAAADVFQLGIEKDPAKHNPHVWQAKYAIMGNSDYKITHEGNTHKEVYQDMGKKVEDLLLNDWQAKSRGYVTDNGMAQLRTAVERVDALERSKMATKEMSSLDAAQKAVLKKVKTMAPDAKLFEAKPDGKYYGPVLYADKKHVVQQVGADTYVTHPRSQLGQLPIEGGETARSLSKLGGTVVAVNYQGNKAEIAPADSDRWHERQLRTPASAEHAAIATKALGDRFSAYEPPGAEWGLSPKYDGVIVGVTDDHLIQRINSRTAMVHNVGPEVAKQFVAGQEATVRYDNGRFKDAQTIERPKEQERQQPTRERAQSQVRDPDDAARAASWKLAKNLVTNAHGSDIKLYAASRLDADSGKYRGPIVAMTDHHVIQRVGNANKFVAHSRDALQGDLQTGRFTQINYTQGKAQVHPVQRSQDRQAGQEQGRPAPQPPRSPERARPSQGMSR
ncbi:hypothetical protein JWH16_04415 [Xanthomonas campestris pv. campestris]|uniref:KfrB domain-containing protein n=1 Tax=Xanthomonas campestris TaxID=339 RepID=UPI001E5A8F08|nr:hypothetical protein [Xanthomonas campestris]MCD0253098.1 hypothetical protein [Xanthomonas campestris pv. campestris]